MGSEHRMSGSLKPCPFCGGKPRYAEVYDRVDCTTDGCQMQVRGQMNPAQWNRRADDRLRREVEKVRDFLKEGRTDAQSIHIEHIDDAIAMRGDAPDTIARYLSARADEIEAALAEGVAQNEQEAEHPKVTGIWLRREGTEDNPIASAVVDVEIDGIWYELIRENAHGCYSHIANIPAALAEGGDAHDNPRPNSPQTGAGITRGALTGPALTPAQRDFFEAAKAHTRWEADLEQYGRGQSRERIRLRKAAVASYRWMLAEAPEEGKG